MRIKVLSGGRKNIELSLSDAELNFQMRRIGIEETVPMCRLVEVSEKDNPLHRFEGQTVNMDEVNFFAKRMESLEEQESSYEAQVEYYTRKIQETDNWKMVGIYADDGKSATNTKKRDDFNAMIKDALDGKIDMILTKSVSRFARNTVDSLLTIRKLKEKNGNGIKLRKSRITHSVVWDFFMEKY